MSGDTNYTFGSTVNMHGGTGNTGIVNNHGGPAAGQAPSADLEEAVQELLTLLRELRAGVPPLSARSIDDSLPALEADTAAEPQERHRALMAVAGIAATAGALGGPVLEAVNRVLALLPG